MSAIFFIPFQSKPIPSFKAVPGGYIFRAPRLALAGPADHYFVDQTQKDQIDELKLGSPARPLMVLIAWYTASLVALLIRLNLIPDVPTTVEIAIFFAVMLAVMPVG